MFSRLRGAPADGSEDVAVVWVTGRYVSAAHSGHGCV